jgi:hypothetical protein
MVLLRGIQPRGRFSSPVAVGSTAEEKKIVCKSLTSIVKTSPLSIDPKAFFMMLTTNYAVLCSNGRLDLGPVWDALSSGHSAEDLFGLFLKFEEKGQELGLQVGLPDPVSRLTPRERRRALAPWEGKAIPNEPSSIEPVALGTGDLKPIITEEMRRRIINIVASAFRASPIGDKVDSSKLVFQIGSGFDQLFDGSRFDLEPIFTALREVLKVDDRDFYNVVVRAKHELSEIGIATHEPKLSLNAIEKQNVEGEVRRADAKAAKERTSSFPPEPGKEKEPPKERKHLTKDEQLRELGLDGAKKKASFPVRGILLGLALAVLGVYAFLTRPNQELDPLAYDSVMPMKRAYLFEGTFQCTIDDPRWFKLPPIERVTRLQQFEALLRKNGKTKDMQCRDSHGRLSITFAGGGNIVGSNFFMNAGVDGKLPEQLILPKAPDIIKKK